MYFILHTLLAFALEPDQIIFNKAATEMNNGNPDGCMKILSSEGREYLYLKKMQELAYICAVSASNLNAANIVREELGPLFLPKHAMDIHHAWMLQNEGKYQEALDTLVPEGWRTRKQRKVGTTMQAMINLYLENYKQAWFISASPHVELKAKITIAHKLRDNGYPDESKELFEHVCPKLDDPELWGCNSILYVPKK